VLDGDEGGEISYERAGPLPDLTSLHERHRLTRHLCGEMAESASVCLSRHHARPSVDVELAKPRGAPVIRSLAWVPPDEVTLQSYANRDDATRDGAYSVALAAVEVELGLLARSRAETRTGADWYVGPPGHFDDLEDALRLEVSGVDSGDRRMVMARVRTKVAQARAGDSDKHALACVVGFLSRLVVIRRVEDQEEA
jgi:hypothetical protein